MSKPGLSNLAAVVKRKIAFPDLFRELFPDNYRKTGNSVCPFHDDKTASFQVSTDHGYCHAGCTPPRGNGTRWSVLDLWMEAQGADFKTAALELAEKYGIVAEPEQKRSREPVATYDYHDEDGKLLFQVCRFEPKDFRQRRPNGTGWTWALSDTRRVLYRLPEVLESDTVWLCEGEKDAESLAALGLCGTTSPQGAGKWPGLVDKYHIHEPLRDKIICILPDNDQAGRDHAREVAASLHGFAASVKILNLADLPEKGDVSDFIQMHGADARKKLEEIAAETAECKVPRTGPEIISCRSLIETEIPPPKWIVQGILPEGLSLLVAKPKAGKSWLCQNIALSVAMGIRALKHFPTEQGTVLNLCLEDNHRRMRERIFAMLNGFDPPQNHLIACDWPAFDKGGVDCLHKFLDSTPNVRLITVDTFGRFRPRRGRVDDVYSSDYSDLQELHSLASLFGIGILLVHHSRKESSDDVVDSILGSTALSGAADSLLILSRKSRTDTNAVLYVSGRDVPDQEHALSFDSGLWTYEGDPIELRMSEERRVIRRILRETGKPLSTSEIVKLTGKQYSATHKLLRRMLEKGEIEKALKEKWMLPPDEDLRYGPPRNREPNHSQGEIHLDVI